MTSRTIQIWEQHAGAAPRLHAETPDLDAVPGVVRAWVSQFENAPCRARQSGDDVLVIGVVLTGRGWVDAPIATLWIEYPDHLLAGMVSHRLDARWRGPGRGASLDTRDGTRRRVGR